MSALLRTDRRELADFDAHFQAQMMPDLAQKEAGRKFRVRLGLCFAALLVIPSVWLAWYAAFQSDDPDVRAMVFPFVVPLLGYFSVIWRLRLKSKKYIISHITSALGWRHRQREKACDLIKTLANHDILPRHTTRAVDDSLDGSHLGRYFQLRELILFKNKFMRRTPVRVFQGLVVSFRLGRETTDTTLISRRGKPEPRRKAQRRYHFAEYKDTQSIVHILSTDHDVLNTVMCIRFRSAIADLEAGFPNAKLACLLSGSQLHVTIQAKNMFEVDWMFEAMDNPVRVQKMLDEFGDVLKLLDIVLARRRCPQTGDLDVSRILTWR